MENSAFNAVLQAARLHGIGVREAALTIAVERVARACRDRGWV